MNKALFAIPIALLCVQTPASAATPIFKPGGVTVGKNLQAFTTVSLSEPAPEDMLLTLTSADPSRLLLSKLPDVEGSPSITIKVRSRFRESPEYWLHGLADSGEVAYTVSAPGLESAKGSVTLTPSGILIVGPFGPSAPEFSTTPRAWPSKISVRVARLDSSLKPVAAGMLRGGLSVDVKIGTSNPAVGALEQSSVRIEAATDQASTAFRPAAGGTAKLVVTPPPGFSAAAESNSVTVVVKAPGLAAGTDMTVGQDLQAAAALSLGEPAPEGGVVVTLKSSHPDKLLLSASPHEKGSASISITLPAGKVTTTYYLQALASEGAVTNTASAPGYTTRVGDIRLAPSGVIISPPDHGPPDEAEVLRPETAGHKQNPFVALLSERQDKPLVLYTAYMHPVSRRAADFTVQPLRPGVKAHVKLESSDPTVGTVAPHVTIESGVEKTVLSFKPLKVGQTVISVVAPDGFATPSNATELLAIVRE